MIKIPCTETGLLVKWDKVTLTDANGALYQAYQCQCKNKVCREDVELYNSSVHHVSPISIFIEIIRTMAA